MADAEVRKTREDVLKEIAAAHARQHVLANTLLENINRNRSEIEQFLVALRGYEPDFVYRFYHQSFKVFGGVNLIQHAV